MNKDFTLQMRPDPNGIAITAQFAPSFPQAGKNLDIRAIPQLPDNETNALRFGDANQAVVDNMTKAVSNWLLGKDLETPLETALSQLSPQEKLRLIFYVDERLRADPNLGVTLADLPFELLKLPGDAVPLILSPKLGAMLHLLEKVPFASVSTTQRTPPLRVLIVHANPKFLGGQVPNPLPIRQQILDLGAALGPNRVEVDVLSRVQGEGVVGLPTRAGLWTRLHDFPAYDILIYLGHGGTDQTFQDLAPIAFLQLEDANGEKPDRLTPDVLAAELQNRPVPVVLLVGCLTAAEVPANELDGLKEAMPRAMRGNQGVAQALVNSSSGVQLAVGMRFRLETNDAQVFLASFFRSLLKYNPGNVEAAVHLAREELNAISPFKGSPASPVVFRVLSDEPMFEWLVRHDLILPDPKLLQLRDIFWRDLAAQSAQSPSVALDSRRQVLDRLQDQIIADMCTHGPVLAAMWKDAAPDDTVSLPVVLRGQLELRELEGKLIVDGAGAAIQGLEGTTALRAAGYRLLRELEGSQAYFRIQPRDNATGKPPEGALMEAQVKLAPTPGVIYPLTLEILQREPAHPLGLLNNAIIVPS